MSNIFISKIIKKIEENVSLLYYIHEVEALLYNEIVDKKMFYYMMTLYVNDYVKDVIFFDKDVAKRSFSEKIHFCDSAEKTKVFWDSILTDEIIEKFKSNKCIDRRLDKNQGGLVFLSDPVLEIEKLMLRAKDEKKRGYSGELQILRELKTLNVKECSQVFFGNYNINLSVDDSGYQSDFIVVSNHVIIIIEVKNWSGEIEIDSIGNCKVNGKYRENPSSQNNRHVSELKKHLIEHYEIDIPIIPIVVFTKKAVIVKVAKKYSNDIINFDQLLPSLEKHLKNYKNGKKYNAKVISSLIEITKASKYPFYEAINLNLLMAYHDDVKQKTSEKNKNQFLRSNFKNYYAKTYYNSIGFKVKFDNEERGFKIESSILNEYTKCKHRYSKVLAVVYNYLLKNNNINSKKDIPTYLVSISKTIQGIDIHSIYSRIYKLMIVILLMLKNNKYELIDDFTILVKFLYKDKEVCILQYAIECLNDYLEKISKMIYDSAIIIKYEQDENIIVGYENDCDIKISSSLFNDIEENELWIEDIIKYAINKNNLDYLIDFLKENADYVSYKRGQLESLIDILNNPNNRIVIMPTGSGKSFIYYMAALLQPKVSIIISPTRYLIKNQIDNLEKIHKLTKVTVLTENLNIKTKHLIYSTPEVLKRDKIIRKIIDTNLDECIYSVILDEVHCLSFQSHNFRPDYFTLSIKLEKFLKKTIF